MLALVMTLSLASFGSIMAETETLTLNPDYSDGVTIEPGQMTVQADVQYGIVTFRETKTLSFIASFNISSICCFVKSCKLIKSFIIKSPH